MWAYSRYPLVSPAVAEAHKLRGKLRELAKDLDFRAKAMGLVPVQCHRRPLQGLDLHPGAAQDGVWHLHVVVATKEDIRTGTDVETLSNYNLPYWLRRANICVMRHWRRNGGPCVRSHANTGSDGWELLPIKKTKEAFARYLGQVFDQDLQPDRTWPQNTGWCVIRGGLGGI